MYVEKQLELLLGAEVHHGQCHVVLDGGGGFRNPTTR